MMCSTKRVTSCLLIIFALITILMEHSASGTTLSCCDRKDSSIAYLKMFENLIENMKQNILSGKSDSDSECQIKPTDCVEVLRSGHNKSGVYTIWPMNRIISGSVDVYCDMDTDGGGWTVIQRRGDYGRSEEYFYKNWTSYKEGFGDIKEDFWLGNQLIFVITNQREYSIRFDLSDFKGNRAYALYDHFWIENEKEQYRLHISDYRGNASDGMTKEHDMKFSTKDRDNDLHSGNCAEVRKGGWWYNSCSVSNINGPYLKGKVSENGVTWYFWKKSYESLSTTEMKIRPKSFQKV